jgi:hypothetical protein
MVGVDVIGHLFLCDFGGNDFKTAFFQGFDTTF